MTDIHARSCRRMWCAVLWALLDDYNRDYHRNKRRDGGAATLRAARRYLHSPSGRTVAALAGIDLNVDAAMAAVVLPRADWQRRGQVGDARSRVEDAA